MNRINVRFNVGHPVDIYSSVYSCPVSGTTFLLIIVLHHGKNGSRRSRNEFTLAITLGRNPRAEFLLLRAEELIVTISVVWMSREKKRKERGGKKVYVKKFQKRERTRMKRWVRESSRVLCVPCGWLCADAFRSGMCYRNGKRQIIISNLAAGARRCHSRKRYTCMYVCIYV